ncbi:hypothetical protein [Ochrobactrum sp. A-1]|uniref:hypothetical protein n=1 Tax=Ochrobactrum sp. A-1 TaxID=2920940 RepID=UPI001F0A1B06|nr:hypothetical protein [Ochrobactrum sp. A-1]
MPFLRSPMTLDCPRMVLLCRDFEPPLAEGAGVFEIVSESEFRFRMTGRPVDMGHSLAALTRSRSDTYNVLSMFRLLLTDVGGREWNAGWVELEADLEGEEWIFTGTSDGLITGSRVASPQDSGAEARFLIPRNFSASIALRRFVQTAREGAEPLPVRTIEVLGQAVTFRFDNEANMLSISTAHSPALPAHATENWLGEPLRILFGQLVYPRLVERRLADGTSMLWVRRSPAWTLDSAWTGLWVSDLRLADDERFFTLYGNLLTLIARGSGFESHTVTSFYEEVIQASRGSRWVWALTLASSIEGLIRILSPRGLLRTDADQAAIDAMRAYISAFQGSSRLRDRAMDVIGRADEISPERALRDLARDGVGTLYQIASWRSVRGRVMHGEFISAYSTEEDDRTILNMVELLRALTIEAARRAAAAAAP